MERILERHTDIVAAAVYPVPDAKSADQVMAAVELRRLTPPSASSARASREFLETQADLGTKWAPRFVRIVDALPLTATGKITKAGIRTERWSCHDPVVWRPERSSPDYRVLTPDDVVALEAEFEAHGRSELLLRP